MKKPVKRSNQHQSNKRTVVIDGSNVAHAELSQAGAPKVYNIVAVRDVVTTQGYRPIVIVDAALRHQIDDPDQLEVLIRKRLVRQAPSRTSADFFILKTAEQQNARIVSNDQFVPYKEHFPWIEKRRLPLMIVDGNVQLYNKEMDGKPRSAKSKATNRSAIPTKANGPVKPRRKPAKRAELSAVGASGRTALNSTVQTRRRKVVS
jgi:hypothetical protein